MRLIDAEPLIKFCTYCADDVTVKIDRNTMAKMLAQAPEIDAVPVVRCKDCRWGREACGNIECFADMNVPSEYHGYEWFCPSGERKDDE